MPVEITRTPSQRAAEAVPSTDPLLTQLAEVRERVAQTNEDVALWSDRVRSARQTLSDAGSTIRRRDGGDALGKAGLIVLLLVLGFSGLIFHILIDMPLRQALRGLARAGAFGGAVIAFAASIGWFSQVLQRRLSPASAPYNLRAARSELDRCLEGRRRANVALEAAQDELTAFTTRLDTAGLAGALALTGAEEGALSPVDEGALALDPPTP